MWPLRLFVKCLRNDHPGLCAGDTVTLGGDVDSLFVTITTSKGASAVGSEKWLGRQVHVHVCIINLYAIYVLGLRMEYVYRNTLYLYLTHISPTHIYCLLLTRCRLPRRRSRRHRRQGQSRSTMQHVWSSKSELRSGTRSTWTVQQQRPGAPCT